VPVVGGTAAYYDDTQINPRSLNVVLSVPGVWTVLVYHQVFSSTILTPFKIII
jgi:hypothetical protein